MKTALRELKRVKRKKRLNQSWTHPSSTPSPVEEIVNSKSGYRFWRQSFSWQTYVCRHFERCYEKICRRILLRKAPLSRESWVGSFCPVTWFSVRSRCSRINTVQWIRDEHIATACEVNPDFMRASILEPLFQSRSSKLQQQLANSMRQREKDMQLVFDVRTDDHFVRIPWALFFSVFSRPEYQRLWVKWGSFSVSHTFPKYTLFGKHDKDGIANTITTIYTADYSYVRAKRVLIPKLSLAILMPQDDEELSTPTWLFHEGGNRDMEGTKLWEISKRARIWIAWICELMARKLSLWEIRIWSCWRFRCWDSISAKSESDQRSFFNSIVKLFWWGWERYWKLSFVNIFSSNDCYIHWSSNNYRFFEKNMNEINEDRYLVIWRLIYDKSSFLLQWD